MDNAYPFVISINNLYYVATKRITFPAIQNVNMHFVNGKRDNLAFAEIDIVFAKQNLYVSDTWNCVITFNTSITNWGACFRYFSQVNNKVYCSEYLDINTIFRHISTYAHFAMPDVIMRNPVLLHAHMSRFWILGKFRVSVLEIIPDSYGRCVVLRDILRKLWYRIHREFQFLFKGVMFHGKMWKRKWHSKLKRKCGTVRRDSPTWSKWRTDATREIIF